MTGLEDLEALADDMERRNVSVTEIYRHPKKTKITISMDTVDGLWLMKIGVKRLFGYARRYEMIIEALKGE